MTIQEIVKRTLAKIKERNLTFTPDVYMELFCQEAKRANVIVEDCQKVEKYLKRLSPEWRQQLQKRGVASVDQLVQFLGSELMRSDPQKCSETIQAYVLLIKRLLQTIEMLYDKEAAAMAKEDLQAIMPHLDKAAIDAIRDRWNRFVMEYDDSFLQALLPHCALSDLHDLRTMVQELTHCLHKEQEDPQLYAPLASLIAASLAPSIAPSMDDEIATISAQVRKDPHLLTSQAMVEDIRQMIKKRIALDKEAVTRQLSELGSIIEHINKTLSGVIDRGKLNHEAICKIQGELGEVDLQSDSFETIHTKLVAIADSLEKETRTLGQQMQESREEVQTLRKKVQVLEEALRKERKRSLSDALTSLPNRRAIDDRIAKEEARFQRYSDNYSVVLFDIDHFKSVNDTYGHDAGDVILATFGKMLRRYSRELDFVGRWGGEEFLVILPKTDKEGAFRFADKLREVIQKSKFMYKNTRIPITVSGGVADRLPFESNKAMLKHADANLYKAKKMGRNKIVA